MNILHINSSQMGAEAARHLSELLKINTVNPPGNESLACEYCARVLARAGIEASILEAQPGRGNLIARLRGNGARAPLLLFAHLDVVGLEPEHWTHLPFAAEIESGYLYGRGALDSKGLAAMELTLFLWLARANVPLARDVILMLNADEENGGACGARWLVAQHPNLMRAEYAITEGGGFGIELCGRRIYSVQTAQKGLARFRLRAYGTPGHGSVPRADNAVVKLAAAVHKIGTAKFPMHITPTTRAYIEGLAKAVGGPTAHSLRILLDGKNGVTLEKIMLDEHLRGLLYPALHNTVTPTMLHAGGKVNVIPTVAEASVDARLLPGQTKESFLKELRAVIDESFEVDFYDSVTPGFEADPASPLFETITRVLKRHDPDAVVLPELLVGATDARHVAKLGAKVYGFAPMFDNASELDRVHGNDERVSLKNVEFGTRVLYDVVSEFTRAG